MDFGRSPEKIKRDPEDLTGEHGEKPQTPMIPEQQALRPLASEVLGRRGMATMQGSVEATSAPSDGDKDDEAIDRVVKQIGNL